MADEPKIKGVVDLVILLDVSGSMKECIQAVRDNVRSFVAGLSRTDANSECPVKDWRIKVCGYRDHAVDPASWFVDNPFVRDVEAVRAQLESSAMEATAGGDEPESLLDSLFKLAKMGSTGVQDAESPDKWRAQGTSARVIAFFTDATFKQPMTIPEAVGAGIDDVNIAVMAEKVIVSGFMPDWVGYERLGAADCMNLNPYIKGPEVAHLGEATPEGQAASLAAINALKGLSKDVEGFKKLMVTLTRTVQKSAQVILEDC